MTTPIVPLARIGSEAPELLIQTAPSLALVRETTTAAPRPWLTPLFASALVVVASFFASPTLTDSLSGKIAGGAALKLSIGYKVLAPICDTLDQIALFSQRQHIAFLITCMLAYSFWRLLRPRNAKSTRARIRAELIAAARGLLVLLAIYVFGATLPRPTAKLAMTSPDEIVVDFHSHTRYSWDGRSGFSPEESRRWHRASGFDVAYVTDHSTFAGAEEAAVDNPAHAGDGTVMLSGIEVRDRGNHLVVLGTDAADWRSYTAGDLHEHTFEREVEARGTARPVVLFTLPGNLKPEAAMSIDGIELSDAAPRGLSQSDALRGQLIGLAGSQRKALVASSNNHGWASASPAWSVMQIHDWRSMTPAQLDIAIRRQLLRDGPNAVRVIDRRPTGPVSFMGVAMTVPGAAWRMLSIMSWPERISWLCWIWLAYFVVMAINRIRESTRARLSRSEEYRIFPSVA